MCIEERSRCLSHIMSNQKALTREQGSRTSEITSVALWPVDTITSSTSPNKSAIYPYKHLTSLKSILLCVAKSGWSRIAKLSTLYGCKAFSDVGRRTSGELGMAGEALSCVSLECGLILW
jgi:hypothetical protein